MGIFRHLLEKIQNADVRREDWKKRALIGGALGVTIYTLIYYSGGMTDKAAAEAFLKGTMTTMGSVMGYDYLKLHYLSKIQKIISSYLSNNQL